VTASTACARLVAVLAASAVAATVLSAAPPAQAQTYWVPASGKVTVHGHGFGHGHGMSQYGAQGAGRAGKSYRQILGFYYPHTRLGRAKGPLRVLLTADHSSDVVVKPAKRLTVRDRADGRSWRLPTGRLDARGWKIALVKGNAKKSAVQYRDRRGWHRWNLPGKRTVLRGDGQLSAKGPLRLVRPGGSTRRYRGVLRSASPFGASKVRDTVNVVSLDQYVRGVLPAEMPTSWTLAALRAQAVAARTYASWSRRAAGNRYWHVCDTTACQVYGGRQAEAARGNRAVSDTRGRILRADGAPAFTQFSASSGGWTSRGGRRYLPAKKDRWDDWSGNAYHDWRRKVGVGFFEQRYPELGALRSIKVTRRDGHGQWGGRALQVELGGSKHSVRLTGDDLRWALGLPSTWFAPRLTPIQRLWERLGGPKSAWGRATAREHPVANKAGLKGVAQRFQHGRMYCSPRTKAHALRGRILEAYGKRHHVAGALGYPTTNIFRVEKGRRAKFQHGSITWLRRSKTVDVHIRR